MQTKAFCDGLSRRDVLRVGAAGLFGFGLTLPRLVAPDDDLADRLQALHIDAAWVLLALVCLHIGAALFHHFGRRDGLLHRMWPRKGA